MRDATESCWNRRTLGCHAPRRTTQAFSRGAHSGEASPNPLRDSRVKVDWTEPHPEDVKALVKAAVKRVLRKRGVKQEDFDGLTDAVLGQAAAMWKDCPEWLKGKLRSDRSSQKSPAYQLL